MSWHKNMKLINYRGGIARFQLPTSWVEEYESAGGGTFSEDNPDSGTIRISVIGAEESSDSDTIETSEELIREIGGTNSVDDPPSGADLGHSVATEMEDGKELSIYTWYIGVPIAENNVRTIIFSYTILSAQKSDPQILQYVGGYRLSKHMVPTHGAITELETALEQIAQLYEGEADGWPEAYDENTA